MSDQATENDDEDENPYAEEDARITALLEKHAAILGEHFESIRIFAVVNRGDGNYGRITRGAGNYFSQFGSVRDWLLETEQDTRNRAGS